MHPTNPGSTSTPAPLVWSVGGLLLTCGWFWAIWDASPIKSPGRGATAIVHVANRAVDVRIGERSVHVEEARSEPLVFPLAAGKHELIMSRAGKVLFREAFDLARGEERTMAAWWIPPGAVDPSGDTR